jgi:hypothetical protein
MSVKLIMIGVKASTSTWITSTPFTAFTEILNLNFQICVTCSLHCLTHLNSICMLVILMLNCWNLLPAYVLNSCQYLCTNVPSATTHCLLLVTLKLGGMFNCYSNFLWKFCPHSQQPVQNRDVLTIVWLIVLLLIIWSL